MHPLPFGVGRRPQFEILDPVVDAIPIAMMHHFVVPEWTTQVYRHHEPVLGDLGLSPDQMAELARNRNLAVAMADVAVAVALPYRLVRQGVAVLQEALVVRRAVALRLVGTVAIR